MIRASLLPLSVFLAACSPPVELPTGGIAVSQTSGDGVCKAEPAQEFVGSQASDELAMPILEAAGAEELRWGGPDTVFTMDFRENRVNAIYDADGVITRVTCG